METLTALCRKQCMHCRILTVCPLYPFFNSNTFCERGLQKALLSFFPFFFLNILITTHHTERQMQSHQCVKQAFNSWEISWHRSFTWSEREISALSMQLEMYFQAFMSRLASIILLFLPPESSMTAAFEYSLWEVKQQQY